MGTFQRFQWMTFITQLLLLLGACQTSPIKDFNSIILGNDKSDVIEKVGGPTWVDRRQGQDRWTYILYQDGIRLERQITFLDGIVTYKGEPIPPFISAEEQDALNAEKNHILDNHFREVTATTKASSPRDNSRSESK